MDDGSVPAAVVEDRRSADRQVVAVETSGCARSSLMRGAADGAKAEAVMPFKKVGRGKRPYRGPSGRRFTLKQVRLYYASGGKFPGRKRKRR